MSKPSSKNHIYATVGDAGHVVSAVSALVFAGAVIRYAGSDNNPAATTTVLFDPQWQADGFCVAGQPDSAWGTSHDVCFYVDVALALLLGLCYLLLKSTKGLEGANKYIAASVFGIVAHGIGHASIARLLRQHGGDFGSAVAELRLHTKLQNKPWLDIVAVQFPMLIFWGGVIWGSMPQSKTVYIVAVIVLAQLGLNLMPVHLAFTYVQTVLVVCFSLNQTNVNDSDKDFSYALHPFVIEIPTTLVGWIESTQCSSFVRSTFYGHVIYDGYIAVSVIVWYLMCYHNATCTHAETVQDKKVV